MLLVMTASAVVLVQVSVLLALFLKATASMLSTLTLALNVVLVQVFALLLLLLLNNFNSIKNLNSLISGLFIFFLTIGILICYTISAKYLNIDSRKLINGGLN